MNETEKGVNTMYRGKSSIFINELACDEYLRKYKPQVEENVKDKTIVIRAGESNVGIFYDRKMSIAHVVDYEIGGFNMAKILVNATVRFQITSHRAIARVNANITNRMARFDFSIPIMIKHGRQIATLEHLVNIVKNGTAEQLLTMQEKKQIDHLDKTFDDRIIATRPVVSQKNEGSHQVYIALDTVAEIKEFMEILERRANEFIPGKEIEKFEVGKR